MYSGLFIFLHFNRFTSDFIKRILFTQVTNQPFSYEAWEDFPEVNAGDSHENRTAIYMCVL